MKTRFKVGDIVEVIDVTEFEEKVAAGKFFWTEEALDENNRGTICHVNEQSGTITLEDRMWRVTAKEKERQGGGVLFTNEQKYIRKVGG